MKYLIMLFVVPAFFWSCDWTPDKIDIDTQTNYRSLNLVLGDTAEVQITGYDLSIADYGSSDVISLEILDSSKIRIIGLELGETQLIIRHVLTVSEGSPDDANATTHLNILVSDGIPLDLILGEEMTISLSDYLTADQVGQIDSISVILADSSVQDQFNFVIENNAVGILSSIPGFQRIEILAVDSLGRLIAPLLFETQSIIRKFALAELFTNAGCVNCPVANESLDHLYLDYPNNFSVIRYHVFWTDPNDPMNLYNPTEVEDRRMYYGGSWEAPRLIMEGEPFSGYGDLESLGSMVNLSIESGSNLYIKEPVVEESVDSIFVDISIQNFGELLNNVNCWTVLTEDSIYYPGTNGEDYHNQVMRDMSEYQLVTLADDVSIQQSLKRPPDFDLLNRMHLVIFLQDAATNQILQTTDHSFHDLLIDASQY